MRRVQKKTRAGGFLGVARLSEFFGFWVGDFDGPSLLALEGAMEVLEAERELKKGDVPDHRVYDLVLAATGSEERAEAALQERIKARNRRHERTEA